MGQIANVLAICPGTFRAISLKNFRSRNLGQNLYFSPSTIPDFRARKLTKLLKLMLFYNYACILTVQARRHLVDRPLP